MCAFLESDEDDKDSPSGYSRDFAEHSQIDADVACCKLHELRIHRYKGIEVVSFLIVWSHDDLASGEDCSRVLDCFKSPVVLPRGRCRARPTTA